MKNFYVVLTLVVALCFSVNDADAQRRSSSSSSSSEFTQNVKLAPLGFLLGNYNLRYERKIGDKNSWQIGGNYLNLDFGGNESSLFGLEAGYRGYFKQSFKGAYWTPFVGFDYGSTEIFEEKESFSQVYVGAGIGYQWVAGGGFIFDLGFGYCYRIGVGVSDNLDADDYTTGGIAFTLACGYAF